MNTATKPALPPLPCPFCARKPSEVHRADTVTSTKEYHAYACMCGGYSSNAHQWGETDAEALAKWNCRAAHPTEQAAPAEKREITTNATWNAAMYAINHPLRQIIEEPQIMLTASDLVEIFKVLSVDYANSAPPMQSAKPDAPAKCTDGGTCGTGGYCDACPSDAAPVQEAQAVGSAWDDPRFKKLTYNLFVAGLNIKSSGAQEEKALGDYVDARVAAALASLHPVREPLTAFPDMTCNACNGSGIGATKDGA